MGENCVVFCVVHSTKAESIYLQFRMINVLFGANSKHTFFRKSIFEFLQILLQTFSRNTLFIPVLQYKCKKMFNDGKK